MVPWLWLRFRDWRYVLYGVLVNLVFLVSSLNEIRAVQKIKDSTQEELLIQGLEVSAMGRGILKFSRRLGMFADAEADHAKGS